MGTVKTIGDKARIKIRDTSKTVYLLDSELLGMINDISESIYQTLCQIESNLIYGIASVTTVADIVEYVPTFDFDGFLASGSWVADNTVYLTQISESEKNRHGYGSSTGEPSFFYLTEDNKIGYLSVPDKAYIISHTFLKPLVELTDYDSDDLPWYGIWDAVFMRQLAVELLEIQERDITRQAMLLEIARSKALNMTYKRGIRQRAQRSGLYSAEGL